MRPRITISMPCYKRPIRTVAAIESVRLQTVQDYEAYFIGDGCPTFNDNVDYGDHIFSFNTDENHGGCGYYQTNLAIQHATGQYFVFLGNDDLIDPDHFENYLSAIEGTDLDFVWFPNYYEAGRLKTFKLKSWQIGHCALIIRTDFLKTMPPHQKHYNHDWTLIDAMIKAGAKYKKGPSKATYHADPYNWRFTNMDGDADSRERKKRTFRQRMDDKLGVCIGVSLLLLLSPLLLIIGILLLLKSIVYGKDNQDHDRLLRDRYV